MMVLLGAHYLPFVFLYGMRMFAVLTGILVGGGVVVGRSLVRREEALEARPAG